MQWKDNKAAHLCHLGVIVHVYVMKEMNTIISKFCPGPKFFSSLLKIMLKTMRYQGLILS